MWLINLWLIMGALILFLTGVIIGILALEALFD